MTDESPAQENWRIFTGNRTPHEATFPMAPPWRRFDQDPVVMRDVPEGWWESAGIGDRGRAATYLASEDTIERVNAALYLRRPLMVTGKAGTGKSSLAYAIAHELRLGPVLRWPITSRSTLQQGLYHYDAISRVQDAALPTTSNPNIGDYIRLGPLGTAFLPTAKPRVLLIDEIDKSDIDLPNDLLNIFEEGEFLLPELFRLRQKHETVPVYPADGEDQVPITGGRVRCREFPLVVMTSNDEREFSAPFLRRCIRLQLRPPDREQLANIVDAHFDRADADAEEKRRELIETFLVRSQSGDLATDQLLNAVFLTCGNLSLASEEHSSSERKQALVDIRSEERRVGK